VYQNKAPSF